MRRLTALLACLLPLCSEANARDFRCEAKAQSDVSESGTLEENNFAPAVIGERFSVDRETGRIVDDLLYNDRFSAPRVLNPGSASNAFRVINVQETPFAGPIVDYLEIQTFAEGEEKPFLLLDDTLGIVTGICRKE